MANEPKLSTCCSSQEASLTVTTVHSSLYAHYTHVHRIHRVTIE